jgi:hypothetical protein
MMNHHRSSLFTLTALTLSLSGVISPNAAAQSPVFLLPTPYSLLPACS